MPGAPLPLPGGAFKSASTPAQRTLTTPRCLLAAGALVSASAIVRSSIAGTLLAWLLMLLGGGMLVAARRAD